ncbi:MAG: hypothetical protein ACI90M_001993, partial [Candidatus Azotimanducaceae bacterium]
GLTLAPAFTTKHGGLSVTAMGTANADASSEETPAQPDE